METNEKELLKIFELYAEENNIKNYPKKVGNKNGYFNKALAFNKRLLREGITNKFLDKDVFYERIINRYGNYGIKKIKNTVFSDYEKYGNIAIKKNKIAINSNNEYIDNFFNEIKGETKKDIDLRKINIKDLSTLLGKYSERKYILNIKGSDKYITASARTLKYINNYEDLSGLDYSSKVGSDLSFVLSIV